MKSVPLVQLNPRWVGSGGEGVYQATGRPCPACPAGQPDPECRTCLGRGQEYEPAPERHGIGVSFDCPCSKCTSQRVGDADADFCLRVFVAFKNPLDAGTPLQDDRHYWDRSGETFESLLLRPSILDRGRCGWHGYVTNGMVETC